MARLAALFDPIEHRIRVLTEVLDPGTLDAWVVLGGFDQVHEVDDVRVEPLLKLLVGDPSLRVECLVCLCEGEHVRVNPSSQMLQWDPQGP